MSAEVSAPTSTNWMVGSAVFLAAARAATHCCHAASSTLNGRSVAFIVFTRPRSLREWNP